MSAGTSAPPAGTAPPHGPALLHGAFTFESLLEAPIREVWQALVRGERRGRWLRLPGRPVPGMPVDLEPGAVETLRAQATIGDSVETLERTTHVVDIVPEHHLVLVYRAVVNDRPRWASLTTVRLDRPVDHDHQTDGIPGESPGNLPDDLTNLTRLTWTEQYTFLQPPGPADIAHLRGGTRLLLTALAVALGTTPRPATERCSALQTGGSRTNRRRARSSAG